MSFFKPTSPRRREVRRNLPRRRSKLPPWLDRKAIAWAVLFALVITVVAAVVAPAVRFPLRYALGQTVREAIVPRVQFKAVDARVTAQRRQNAYDSEPSVYTQNTAYFQQVRDALNRLPQNGELYQNVDQIPDSVRQELKIDAAALASFKSFNSSPEQKKLWHDSVDKFISGLGVIALLDEERKQTEKQSFPNYILIVHPEYGELQRPATAFYGTRDLASFRRLATDYAMETFHTPAIHNAVIETAMLRGMAEPLPTYVFDKNETERRRQAAFDDESNRAEMTYRPDRVLIAANTRLDKTGLELLQKEHAAYLQSLDLNRLWLIHGGRFGIMALIAAAFWLHILAFNPTVCRNPLRGLAITALLLLCQAAAVLATEAMPEFILAFAAFPTLLAAIVLAISYDQRFALGMGALQAMLVAVSVGASIDAAIVLLVGVTVAVSLLSEVRTRSKLVTVGGWAGLAMAIAALITGMTDRLLRFDDGLAQAATDAAAVLASGVAIGIFVQAVLPVVERLFQVTTAMTLKELNDASRPLLRRLAEEAPGTYQHSLRIADIAEAAADAIGANGLLCRVGAMYHDVGKIDKPTYFVENQLGGPNRHARLSPAMSLLIIVGHVKNGVEMAREYGLPRLVRHFIQSHHGTTLVEYFFHAAKQKQRSDSNDPEPAEFAFRYPGPKPQTREAAILMLCDTIEGAARALQERTAVRLEQLAHTLANKRLMDSQFDECNLTLKDLHKIETAITKSLCAIYHTRIEYPTDQPQESPQPDEQQPDTETAAS